MNAQDRRIDEQDCLIADQAALLQLRSSLMFYLSVAKAAMVLCICLVGISQMSKHKALWKSFCEPTTLFPPNW
jgi:hypothetical protein